MRITWTVEPEQWEKIEVALGFTEHDPVRRDKMWKELSWGVFSDLSLFQPQPRPPAEYCRAYASLLRAAEKFHRLMPDDGRWDRDVFQEQIIDALCDDWNPSRDVWPKSEGRPANLALTVVIVRLDKVYQKWTGKEPGVSQDPNQDYEPGGPFFRFVLACLEVFDFLQIKKEGKALASAIKRAFKLETDQPWREQVFKVQNSADL